MAFTSWLVLPPFHIQISSNCDGLRETIGAGQQGGEETYLRSTKRKKQKQERPRELPNHSHSMASRARRQTVQVRETLAFVSGGGAAATAVAGEAWEDGLAGDGGVDVHDSYFLGLFLEKQGCSLFGQGLAVVVRGAGC